MVVHETPPYLTRIGGHWEEDKEGKPILVGGEDKWVYPPPEFHTDDCPCYRCYAQMQTLIQTREQIENTPVQEEYEDPELTPEDLERLRGEGA